MYGLVNIMRSRQVCQCRHSHEFLTLAGDALALVVALAASLADGDIALVTHTCNGRLHDTKM